MKKIILIIITTFSPLLSHAQCWLSVTTGGVHSMGIGADNSLWGWGRGTLGQLGSGNYTNSNVPIKVSLELNWAKLSAGNAHTLALKTDGTLWSWGRNTLGQLGKGVVGGNYAIVDKIGTDNTWVFISSGDEYSTAIKSDGTLWAWGDNLYGQLGDGTSGTVENKPSPTQVGTDNDWAMVAAANNHTVAIKTNGTLWAWGRNNSGQLGDGTNFDRVLPVQVGTDTNWTNVTSSLYHNVALKGDGSLWTWGLNINGQLGDGTIIDQNAPINIEPTFTFTKIARGAQHIIVEKSDGTIWSSGLNNSGQLGNSTVVSSAVLVPISSTITPWTMITSRLSHCAAVAADGKLYMWGSNLYGQLGNMASASAVSTPINTVCPVLLANQNFSLSDGFKIYPNPAQSILNIDPLENEVLSKISISDMTGKTIIEKTDNVASVNVENLSNGMYIIQISTDQKTFQGKFIKN